MGVSIRPAGFARFLSFFFLLLLFVSPFFLFAVSAQVDDSPSDSELLLENVVDFNYLAALGAASDFASGSSSGGNEAFDSSSSNPGFFSSGGSSGTGIPQEPESSTPFESFSGESGGSGDSGMTGESGETGFTGESGMTGDSGESGFTGGSESESGSGMDSESAGSSGGSGEPGETGQTGSGDSGATGQSGESGTTGEGESSEPVEPPMPYSSSTGPIDEPVESGESSSYDSSTGFESSDDFSFSSSTGTDSTPPAGPLSITALSFIGYRVGLAFPDPLDERGLMPYLDGVTNADLLRVNYYFYLNADVRIGGARAAGSQYASVSLNWTHTSSEEVLAFSDSRPSGQFVSGIYKNIVELPKGATPGVYALSGVEFVTVDGTTLRLDSPAALSGYPTSFGLSEIHAEYDRYPSDSCFDREAALADLCGVDFLARVYPAFCPKPCAQNKTDNFVRFYSDCLANFSSPISNRPDIDTLFDDCATKRLPSDFYPVDKRAMCENLESEVIDNCPADPMDTDPFLLTGECPGLCHVPLQTWFAECLMAMPNTDEYYGMFEATTVSCLSNQAPYAPEGLEVFPLTDSDGRQLYAAWDLVFVVPDIIRYDVKILNEMGEEISNTSMPFDFNFIFVDTLQPFTNYSFAVSGFNGVPVPGVSSQAFTSLPARSPGPTNLSVEDTANVQVKRFTFTPVPDAELPRGTTEVDSYFIELQPIDANGAEAGDPINYFADIGESVVLVTGLFPASSYNCTAYGFTNSGVTWPSNTVQITIPPIKPVPVEDFIILDADSDGDEVFDGFRIIFSAALDVFSDPALGIPEQQITKFHLIIREWINSTDFTDHTVILDAPADLDDFIEYVFNNSTGMGIAVDYDVFVLQKNAAGLFSDPSEVYPIVMEPDLSFDASQKVQISVRSTMITVTVDATPNSIHLVTYSREGAQDNTLAEATDETGGSLAFEFAQGVLANTSFSIEYFCAGGFRTTRYPELQYKEAAFFVLEDRTKPLPPQIIRALALNISNDLTISLSFDGPVTQPDLSNIGNLIQFESSPAYTVVPSMFTAEWVDNTRLRLHVSGSDPSLLPNIGSLIFFSPDFNLEGEGGSDLIVGPSAPLSGTFGEIDFLPATNGFRFPAVDQNVPCTMNLAQAFSVHPLIQPLTLTIQASTSLPGAVLDRTSSSGVGSAALQTFSLDVSNGQLVNQAQGTAVTLRLMDGALQVAQSAFLCYVNHINHPPAISSPASVFNILVSQWSNFTSGFSSPVQISDPDAIWAPRAQMRLSIIASEKLLFSVNGGVSSSDSSLILSGTLAQINNQLSRLQVRVTPFPNLITVDFALSDGGNGASPKAAREFSASLSASASFTLRTDCSSATPITIRQAVVNRNGQSINFMFSDAVRSSNAAATDCFDLLDVTPLTITQMFGSGATCDQRSPISIRVNLGSASQFTPGVSQIRLAATAMPSCVVGSTSARTAPRRSLLEFAVPDRVLLQSGDVQGVSNPDPPIVTLTGPSTITTCDDLIVSATATNLGGKAASFSWSTDIPGITIGAGNYQQANRQTFTIPAAQFSQAVNTGRLNVASNPTYNVQVFVTNWLYATSDIVRFPVTLSRNPVPRVSIGIGSRYALNLQNAPSTMNIPAVVTFSSCFAGREFNLTYRWTVTPTTFNFNTFTPVTDAAILSFPTNLLVPGTTYTFTVLVSLASNPLFNGTATSTMTVTRGPLGASIQGDLVGNSVVSPSLDINLLGVVSDTNAFNPTYFYGWSCKTLSSTGSMIDCSIGARPTRSQNSWRIPANTLAPGASYFFDLTVSSGTAGDPRTANAAQVAINTASALQHSVAVFGPKRVTTDDYLSLLAIVYYPVASPSNYVYRWSVKCISNPRDASVNVIQRFLNFLPASSRAVSLNFNRAPRYFAQGGTYEFTAVAVDTATGKEASSSVRLTVIAPPVNGDISITFAGPFLQSTLQAISWESASTEPLHYKFYFVNELTRDRIYLNRPTAITRIDAILPVGFGPSGDLRVGVEVIDPIRGASSWVEKTITSRLLGTSRFVSDSASFSPYTAILNYVNLAAELGRATSQLQTSQLYEPVYQMSVAAMLAEIQHYSGNLSVTSNGVQTMNWLKYRCRVANPLSGLGVSRFYSSLIRPVQLMMGDTNLKVTSFELQASQISIAFDLLGTIISVSRASSIYISPTTVEQFFLAYQDFSTEFATVLPSIPLFRYNPYQEDLRRVLWDAVEKEQGKVKRMLRSAVQMLDDAVIDPASLPSDCSTAVRRRLLATNSIDYSALNRTQVDASYSQIRLALALASATVMLVPGDSYSAPSGMLIPSLTRISQGTSLNRTIDPSLELIVQSAPAADPINPPSVDVREIFAPVNIITWPALNSVSLPSGASANNTIISGAMTVEILDPNANSTLVNDARAARYNVTMRFAVAKSTCTAVTGFTCSMRCFRRNGNTWSTTGVTTTIVAHSDTSFNWVQCFGDAGSGLTENTVVVQAAYAVAGGGGGGGGGGGATGSSASASSSGGGGGGAASSSSSGGGGGGGTTPPPADAGAGSSGAGLAIGAAVGGAVGGLVLIGSLVVFMRRRNAKANKFHPESTPAASAAATAAANATGQAFVRIRQTDDQQPVMVDQQAASAGGGDGGHFQYQNAPPTEDPATAHYQFQDNGASPNAPQESEQTFHYINN